MEELNIKIDGNKDTQRNNHTNAQEKSRSALKQTLEQEMSDWKINAFGEYIKQFCTKDEGWELLITLPPVKWKFWKFKWFNFKCKTRDLIHFLNKEAFFKYRYLGENIANLLYELENYIKAYWIEIDEYEIQDLILNPILEKYRTSDN